MSYKIGQLVTVKYDNAPLPQEKQYQIGQRVFIKQGDKEAKDKKLATIVIQATNENEAVGVVINTYGHKRRNGKE